MAKFNPNANKDVKVIKSFRPMQYEDQDGNKWTLTADKDTSRKTLRKNDEMVYSHAYSQAGINKARQLGITLEVA